MNNPSLDFIAAFEYIQRDAAATNKRNGFSNDDELLMIFERFLETQVPVRTYEQFIPLLSTFKNARIGLKLMLAVGELGETLEAVRKDVGSDSHCPEFSAEVVEIADNILRLMNYATDRNLPLAAAIVAKNKYNRDRKDHSAASRASKHGKRF